MKIQLIKLLSYFTSFVGAEYLTKPWTRTFYSGYYVLKWRKLN